MIAQPLTRVDTGVKLTRVFTTTESAFVFDGSIHRYRDSNTGRLVSEKNVRSLRDDVTSFYETKMRSIGLDAPSLGTGRTATAMTKATHDAMIVNYLIGAGGVNNMSETDWKQLGSLNKEAAQHIQDAKWINTPTDYTDAQRQNFAGMSAGESTRAHSIAMATEAGINLPVHPGEGSPCGGNCRCHWRIESIEGPGGKVYPAAYWESIDDGGTCSVCAGRAVEYNPWIDEVAVLPDEEIATREEADRVAKELVAQATRAEPQVSADLRRMVAETGGTVDGSFVRDGVEVKLFDFRLKTEASLTRKLVTDATKTGYAPDTLRHRMYDVLRYTDVVDPKSYGKSVASMSEKLIDNGYIPVRTKNFWKLNDEGYAGINSVWRTPTGQQFELQFHTQKTIDTKEVISHPLYDQQRLLEPGSKSFDTIDIEVNDAWREVRDDSPSMIGLKKAEKLYP